METPSGFEVFAEICACASQSVKCRRAVKDSQEQWYAVGGVRPSSDDLACRSGVGISNILE